MRITSFPFTLALVGIFSAGLADTAQGASPAPALNNATIAQWNDFTRQRIEQSDFDGLRQVIAEKIAIETPREAASLLPQKPVLALALAQHEFLRAALGYGAPAPAKGKPGAEPQALAKISRMPQGRDFLIWLLTNTEALEEYCTAADAALTGASRLNGLEGWCEIWSKYPESRAPGVWRRLADAIAVSFAEPHVRSGETITPFSRFAFYRESHAKGQLVPYFEQAPVFELVLVVHGGRRFNEELEWAQLVTPANKKNQKDVGNYGHSCLAYRGHNYRQQSVQGDQYFDYKYNDMTHIMEYGSVCGGISHFNMMIAVAHGAPAFTVGQPGHCAYLWKSDSNTWSGGNFVSGWAETYDSHQQPFWASRYSANINALSKALADPQFPLAQRLRWAARAVGTNETSKAAHWLAAATQAAPLHYLAWKDRLHLAARDANTPLTAWQQMADGLAAAYPEFPAILNDLLGEFDTKKFWPLAGDDERLALAAAVVKSMTSLPDKKQWHLAGPAFRSFLSRQLAATGISERRARAAIEGTLELKKNPADKTSWDNLREEQKNLAEKLLVSLLPVTQSNSAFYSAVATAYLTVTADDLKAGPRALRYFQTQAQTAATLDQLETLAEPVLGAIRASAEARAEFAGALRARAAALKSTDAGSLANLQNILARYDFRERGKVGGWENAQPPAGTNALSLKWDLTPSLVLADDDYLLHLNFRWLAGGAVKVSQVRLLEGDREIAADKRTETADQNLKPAVFTLRAPKAKPGQRYYLQAVLSGGNKDSKGMVLSRWERNPPFKKEDFAAIGSWSPGEFKKWSEITENWHEAEFDLTPHLRKGGQIVVRFQYGSYGSPRIMNVRLLENEREIAQDLRVANPIANANNVYALMLPARRPDAKYTIKALFQKVDGYGTVYVRKQEG